MAAPIALAVVGFEEGPDDAVRVEGDECPGLAIVARDHAVSPYGFEDRLDRPGVAQELRLPQVILLGDAAELRTMLGVVLVEAALVGEADRRSPGANARRVARLRTERPARGPLSAEARDPSSVRAWGSAVGFADQRRLDEHYAKHGAEFGRITKQDYLRQAQLLRDARPVEPVLEAVRRDGVITRYDRQTGAFIAFNPNGIIRTFFKPNDGERYWRRQAERGE